jgi:hypothetical protein
VRDVFEALERLGIRYFVTGSVAASVHGVLRQTHDTDVVVAMGIGGFATLGREFAETHAIAEPMDHGEFAMASIIDRSTADKVDIILREPGPFETSALARRRRHHIPGLGEVWVASVEDLVLAKLVWSEGTSELQLRDCAGLLRLHAASVDDAYLDAWADRLGMTDLLTRVRDAT